MAAKEYDTTAIGIDLGTTYSCVAVWKHGRTEIIANDQGNRTTPSCVAFVDSERLIGDSAKNQAPMNPANTIFDAKRLIGRRFSDSKVQEDMKLWPFSVIKGCTDTPKIVITYKGREKEFVAEEISSMILVKMKDIADTYLGKSVKHVVITVPGYFNDSQRQATKDASTIAGLNILRMINEPTAAAIAYGLDKKSDIVGLVHVLVFDLGGGTFDVSLMSIEEGGVFEVKAISGDTHLGGEDFDKNMVDHCVAEFKRKWNKDLTGNQRALGRLRFACEKAKRSLSCTSTTSIELDALHEGIDFSMKFTRAKFEELNMKLFDNCIETLDKCLNDTNMKKSWVDEIILVGGSTRIPMIQRKLQEFFDGKELCKSMNPDEAVAYGAAVMAANLSGNSYDKCVQDVILHDVIPLSLGIQVKENLFSCVIPRNTIIPTKVEKFYVTTEDNKSSACFKVYQGERVRSIDNYLLGELYVFGIPRVPRGTLAFKVCLEVDANNIITFTAVILATGKTKKLTFTNKNGRLTKKKVDKMIKDAEMYKLKDEEFKKKVDAYNALDECLYVLKKKMKEYKINKTMKNDNLRKLENAISETTMWLLDNQAAGIDELERKKVKLQSMVKHFETEPRLKSEKKFGTFRSLFRFKE